MSLLRCVLSTFLAASSLLAEVKLHPLFSDHAVLQVGLQLPVWGWATAGEEVTVKLSDQTLQTKADSQGKWRVEFNPLRPTSKALELTATGSSVATAKDLLVGEVWLGSGQSNMAMRVNSAKDWAKEQPAATESRIRMFTVEGDTMSATPLETCEGRWIICSPETVGLMSATLYFFGRDLQSKLGGAVGLINSSTGGTPIESWNSLSAQEAEPKLAPLLKTLRANVIDEAGLKAKYEQQLVEWKTLAVAAKKEGKPVPQRPKDMASTLKRKADIGGRFNGKIAPLIGYPIAGALWYQGEANSTTERADFYQWQMQSLITDWRKRWGYEFPVGLVQLPNFLGRGEPWLKVRDAVRRSMESLPLVGLAVTIDVGDDKDIHPKDKQTVGRRLATWALSTTYSMDAQPMGPMYQSHSVQGQDLVARFRFADELVLKEGGSGFEICGKDGVWKPAKVQVVARVLLLNAQGVFSPVAVRYGWQESPKATLWNESGLPASPFTSDFITRE